MRTYCNPPKCNFRGVQPHIDSNVMWSIILCTRNARIQTASETRECIWSSCMRSSCTSAMHVRGWIFSQNVCVREGEKELRTSGCATGCVLAWDACVCVSVWLKRILTLCEQRTHNYKHAIHTHTYTHIWRFEPPYQIECTNFRICVQDAILRYICANVQACFFLLRIFAIFIFLFRSIWNRDRRWASCYQLNEMKRDSNK